MDNQAVTRFWDNYIEQLKRYGIAPKLLRWHVRHAEQYIQAHPRHRLAAHSAQGSQQPPSRRGGHARRV